MSNIEKKKINKQNTNTKTKNVAQPNYSTKGLLHFLS